MSWTLERRLKQAEAIRRWRPWEKSTGPRTSAGKAVSSRNADRGKKREVSRARMRIVAELFREYGRCMAQLRELRHLAKRTRPI